MNAKHIMKKKIKGKTNWDKVKSLTEKQIISAAKSDLDASLLTSTQLKKFKRAAKSSTKSFSSLTSIPSK